MVDRDEFRVSPARNYSSGDLSSFCFSLISNQSNYSPRSFGTNEALSLGKQPRAEYFLLSANSGRGNRRGCG